MPEKIKKYFTPEYISVTLILIVAFVLRIFRVNEILGFYYDQGRDAQVIWDLIHSHKFFLIGPTTGLAGIFRGPFYYYLIAPFYLFGKGNPVWSAIFLAFLSVIALAIIYSAAKEIGGKITGFIALILGTFSFEIIYASRWLSNPTPMLFLSMILVWCLFRILDKNKSIYWIILSVILGLSFFHFGSSGELFYFLAIPIFAIYFKKFPNIKTFIISVVFFLLTFSPLFFFDIRHGNILLNNITGMVGGGKSFGIPTWQFVLDRLSLIGVYFSSILFHSPFVKEWIHISIIFIAFVAFVPKLLKDDKLKVIMMFLGSVTLGLLFFQGNSGNLYQYYLTGYYLIFIILIASLFGEIFKTNWIGKVFVIYFALYFLGQNWMWVKPYLYTTGTEPDVIILDNQKEAIDWIYKSAGSSQFNVDVYVPPVLPYSYNYLFTWLGTYKYNKLPVESQVPLLYTLYEVDPPHPERLKAWLDRQSGIGKVIKERTFGGVTVQERRRIVVQK